MKSLAMFVRRHELTLFFVLVFVCTWLPHAFEVADQWGWIAALPSPTVSNLLTALSLIGGPAGVALLLTILTGGWAGLKQRLAPLFRWRVGLGWYLLTIFSYPIIALLVFAISEVLTGGRGPSLSASSNARLSEMSSGLGISTDNLPSVIPTLVIYGFLVVPLYEELGWRGFEAACIITRV